jgi:hypothetical protein
VISPFSSGLSPFFFNCFGVNPAEGRIYVPLLEASAQNPFGFLIPHPLQLNNVDRFTRLTMSSLGDRFQKRAVVPDSDWSITQVGETTLHFASSREGRSVTLDSQGALTRTVNGTRQGIAVEVAAYGPFSRASLAQGISLRSLRPRPHSLYQIEFGGFGITGLRKFLKLSQETPIITVALALYDRLDLSSPPELIDPDAEQGLTDERALVAELRSHEKGRPCRVAIEGGFDPALLGAVGSFSETLKISVEPEDFQNAGLSPVLLPFWDLAFRLTREFNQQRQPELIDEKHLLYADHARQLYGTQDPEDPHDLN